MANLFALACLALALSALLITRSVVHPRPAGGATSTPSPEVQRRRNLRDRGKVLGVGIAALTVATLGLPATPAFAEVIATPDVRNLPAGSMPQLPYVNWPARVIVDGSHRVSISGIQARVTELHKVEGGYLLRRQLNASTRAEDVVFVTTNGARRSISPVHWQRPIKVSKDGFRAAITRPRVEDDRIVYADTAVLQLPSGRMLYSHDFGTYAPGVHLFGMERVLLTVNNEAQGLRPDLIWWTPATGGTETVREAAAVESADQSAWQWAIRPLDGLNSYGVLPIPPDTGSGWSVAQEDENLGSWSTNDALIWGNNEITDQAEGYYGSTSYLIHRASDGKRLMSIRNGVAPWATWESESALLLRAAYGEGSGRRHQLIRCRLS